MELSAPWARIAPALVLALAASVGAAAESGKAWFDGGAWLNASRLVTPLRFSRRWLRRAPLRRIVPLFLIERPVEFEPIREHDHGLGAALALIHRESDRLGAVYEQAAEKASGVLDDP